MEVQVCGTTNTNIKIISYQFLLNLLEGTNHEQSSQSTWRFPVLGDFFKIKNNFLWGDKLFWAKHLWGGYSK